MLEQESAFYKAHQAEFRGKYLDKWLVITNESLCGAYDTLQEAAKAALDQFKPGQFIIHRPSDDGKVMKIGPVIQYAGSGQKARPKPVITVTSGNLAAFPYA